jgi:hypothetical protein
MDSLEFNGGEASLGYAYNYPPYNEPTSFYVDNGQRRIGHGHPVFGNPGSGTTSVCGGFLSSWWGVVPYHVEEHEFAHHWMTNGSAYGHNGGGFWATLNDWAFRYTGQWHSPTNSFERELLGWIAPDSIYQTTYNVTLTDSSVRAGQSKSRCPDQTLTNTSGLSIT